MKTMKERIESVGGKFSLDYGSEGGLTVQAKIPLKTAVQK